MSALFKASQPRSWIMKALAALAAFSLWLACKPPNFADLIPVEQVDHDALNAASHALCTPEEKLIAREASADEKLERFPREIVAFGFFKGTSGCALTADYKQDGIFDEWFSITLQDNCLVNGSVWNIRNISYPDHSVEMELSQVKRTPEYVVKIKAGEMVSMKSLANAAGLISYRCEPKTPAQ